VKREQRQMLFISCCGLVLFLGVTMPVLSTPNERPPMFNADVHYDLTYILAIEAGFSTDEAKVIAKCDQGVDEDETTVAKAPDVGLEWKWPPVSASVKPDSPNFRFHFVQKKQLDDLWNNQIKKGANLCTLGVFLHALQDNFSHRNDLSDGWHGLTGVDDTSHDLEMSRKMAYNTYRILVLYRWYRHHEEIPLVGNGKGGARSTDVKTWGDYIKISYPLVEQELDLLQWLADGKPGRGGASGTKVMGVDVPAHTAVRTLGTDKGGEGADLKIFKGKEEKK